MGHLGICRVGNFGWMYDRVVGLLDGSSVERLESVSTQNSESWTVDASKKSCSPRHPGQLALQDICEALQVKSSRMTSKSKSPGSLVKCPGHLALGVLDCGRLQEAIQSRTSRKTCSHKCPRSLASKIIQEDL